MKTSKGGRSANGQIMVILALGLFGLLALCTLGVDVLHIYWQKSRLQAGADAAALAGATFLPADVAFTPDARCTYGGKAQNAACTLALTNAVKQSEITSITVASDNNSVTVQLSRVVPALFAKLLGYKIFTVNVGATAEIRPLSSAEKVLPVGLDSTTPYKKDSEIALHLGNKTDPCGAGCWHGLALTSFNGGNNGGNVFRDNLIQGCNCTLSTDDPATNQVTSEPGATTGPTQQGVSQRINNGLALFPSGTYLEHDPSDPRIVAVPVVQWTMTPGRSDYSGTVVGFYLVWLNGVGTGPCVGQPQPQACIDATFIEGMWTGTPGSGGNVTGALHAVLVK